MQKTNPICHQCTKQIILEIVNKNVEEPLVVGGCRSWLLLVTTRWLHHPVVMPLKGTMLQRRMDIRWAGDKREDVMRWDQMLQHISWMGSKHSEIWSMQPFRAGHSAQGAVGLSYGIGVHTSECSAVLAYQFSAAIDKRSLSE